MSIPSKTFADKIFSGMGPISSFASKTDVCYALRLIDERTYVDLTHINKIRVVFAHTSTLLDMNSPAVVKVLNNFPGYEVRDHNDIKYFVDVVKRVGDQIDTSIKDH